MKTRLLALILCCSLSCACAAQVPPGATQITPQTLADRQIQTRRFETANYQAMLSAASSVYQDLGFTLDESEYTLGVIVGSKHRDATSGAQIAGAILVAALTGAVAHVDRDQIIRVSMVMRELEGAKPESRVETKLSPEKIQSIETKLSKAISEGLKDKFPAEVSDRVAAKIAGDAAKSLGEDLTRLAQVKEGSGESTVRVTFQRVVYNTAGQITLTEQIKDPELYKEFFDKLSQAVFLEAHEI